MTKMLDENELYCLERLGIKNVRGKLAKQLREWPPVLTREELHDLPLCRGRFLVVDLETTGGRAAGARIIEVGAVEVNGFRLGRELSSLVNPGAPVPRFVTSLTGIQDFMLEQAPPLEVVLPSLSEMLKGRVLAAHNLSFDRAFLKNAWVRVFEAPLKAPAICTVRLSRRVFPDLASHNLDSLTQHLRIRPEPRGARSRHRALGDARITARALIAILRKLEAEGLATIGELIALQSAQRARSKPLPVRSKDDA